jgi:hypothetical protein
MNLNILCDANWESKIDHALKVLDTGVMNERDYGDGLVKLVVILNCRDPALEHKQRIRFSRKEKILYIDVMLELETFIRATHVSRRRRISEALLQQLGSAMKTRKIANFNVEEFMQDLSILLDTQLNGSESSRFDLNCLEVATGY